MPLSSRQRPGRGETLFLRISDFHTPEPGAEGPGLGGPVPAGSVPAAELIDFTIITLRKKRGQGRGHKPVQTTAASRAPGRATVRRALAGSGLHLLSVCYVEAMPWDSLRLSLMLPTW